MNRGTLEAVLLSSGCVSPEVYEECRNRKGSAGSESVLVRLLDTDLVNTSEVLKVLGDYFGMDVTESIPQNALDSELVKAVPIAYLKKNMAVPFRGDGESCLVALSDPTNFKVLDDLRVALGIQSVRPVLAPPRAVLGAVNELYGEGVSGDSGEYISALNIKDKELDEFSETKKAMDLLDDSGDAPVIRMVNHILASAVKSRASDVHIEPFDDKLRIRFRLDGVLYDRMELNASASSALASRVKIMAGLNIAEKRLPQDGRIEIAIGDREVDLRVSTIPTASGERVVLRLLEKGARLLTLEEIGFDSELLAQFRKLITIPNGIILVTGPTGSGKTTTLYSALNEINTSDKNILTIEDPVEYRLEGIGQMQVQSKIGLTFARGLRAMVRQDPDVILIGEIRDLETAETAIQAALTGHLVFSTLHTNDAPSSITRLIDMGIEPFLAASAVKAVLAQRLTRTLCPECKRPVSPDLFAAKYPDVNVGEVDFYEPAPEGCDYCRQTGYRGRRAIFEYMSVTDSLASLITRTTAAGDIRAEARKQGMSSLRESGLTLARTGETSPDEVFRITQG